MSEPNPKKEPNQRGYTPAQEKWIPIAIAIFVIIALGMLVLAAAIALGYTPG